MPGVTIGSNVVIEAGAIVMKNVYDNCSVAGVPVKKTDSYDEYFQKIKTKSVHLRNFQRQQKDKALIDYYCYTGNSESIYY